jgi:TPR repeat protein
MSCFIFKNCHQGWIHFICARPQTSKEASKKLFRAISQLFSSNVIIFTKMPVSILSVSQGNREILATSASQGDAESMAVLAGMHMYFIGGNRNPQIVKQYLDLACEAQIALAFALRAENHFFGENGYESNESLALEDCQRAIELGDR